MFMSEIFGEDFFLKLFNLFDDDLVITIPGEVLLMLLFLIVKKEILPRYGRVSWWIMGCDLWMVLIMGGDGWWSYLMNCLFYVLFYALKLLNAIDAWSNLF